MTEEEARNFLSETKALLRLATIRPDGYPDVHTLWFTYLNDKIYATTHKNSKKLKNLRQNKKVSFTIDVNTRPYKGVRGRGEAKLIEDENLSMKVITKGILKYIGSMEDPAAKRLLSLAPEEVVIEITPLYLSTWNGSKRA